MNLIDLIFPQNTRCIFCHREVERFAICDSCYNKLPFIGKVTCTKCGGELKEVGFCNDCKKYKHEFIKNYSILNYDDAIQEKIVSFKQGKRKNIGVAFSHIIKEYLDKINNKFDVIIPMPIHKNRQKERKFNQAEILTSKLDKVDKNILIRVKDTPHQTGLGRKNRENNLAGAFEVIDKKKIKGKIVLVVDDIFTTGATLDEVSRTLYNNGAKMVFGLCLARKKRNE